MFVDASLVRRLGDLARLELTEDEISGAVEHLSRFLAHADQLSTVEVERQDAELMAVEGRPATPLRADVVVPGGGQADALANAPRAHEGFFVVPRVLK